MFSGIVTEVGKIVSISTGRLVAGAGRILEGMEVGGSIAINGVCLTVTVFDSQAGNFTVDIMPETLLKTNIGKLKTGDRINLERPLRYNGEVGGHLVQGHVDTTGRVESIIPDGEALRMRFIAPAAVMRYIVEKGFIAIDGASLTVVEKDTTTFAVSIVSYTRNNTVLGSRRIGDIVNLEVDIIAKYVEQFSRYPGADITLNVLKDNGFIR